MLKITPAWPGLYLITDVRTLQAQVLLHREVDRDHEEAVIEFGGIYYVD